MFNNLNTKKKQILMGGGFFLAGLLLILGASSVQNRSSYSEDTGEYTVNEYTGDLDFNDPNQEDEGDGPSTASIRNMDKLISLTDASFAADTSTRISEYVSYQLPDEREFYLIEDTFTVNENVYIFELEAGISKQRFSVEVFEARQNYANVYIDDNGPYNFISPFYIPVEEADFN